MTFRTYFTSKALRTIKDIVRTEDLTVAILSVENAIGDSMIEVRGKHEDVEIVKQIFNMVY